MPLFRAYGGRNWFIEAKAVNKNLIKYVNTEEYMSIGGGVEDSMRP